MWIRFNPQAHNGPAGSIFARICPARVVSNDVGAPGNPSADHGHCKNTTYVTQRYSITNTVFSMAFTNMAAYGNNDDGLVENPCYPEILADDPGFALKSDDPWYTKPVNAQRRPFKELYKAPPPQDILLLAGIAGWPKDGYSKRDADGGFDPEEIFIDEGNSTRRPTEEKLLEALRKLWPSSLQGWV